MTSKGNGGDTNFSWCHSTHPPWRKGDNMWLIMWEMHLCSLRTGTGARKSSVLNQDPEMDCSWGFGQLTYTSLLTMFVSTRELGDVYSLWRNNTFNPWQGSRGWQMASLITAEQGAGIPSQFPGWSWALEPKIAGTHNHDKKEKRLSPESMQFLVDLSSVWTQLTCSSNQCFVRGQMCLKSPCATSEKLLLCKSQNVSLGPHQHR